VKRTIFVGTRSSELALWQSEFIKNRIKEYWPDQDIQIVKIKTSGDKILDAPLSKIGDKGLFTKELDIALLEKKIDLAVHSLKDIPTQIPDGLKLSCITEREDVRDVFIPHPSHPGTKIADIPTGGTVATGSLRRRCQLLYQRPDLKVVDIRGNLNSRMEKLKNSNWNGMILAYAGVRRLGWEKSIGEILPVSQFLPAVGQGALGIITRDEDTELGEILSPINHYDTYRETLAERALLRYLEGGCQIPIGAYGKLEGSHIRLQAMVGDLNGKTIIKNSHSGPAEKFEETGIGLAVLLIKMGAGLILNEIRNLPA
jgi:hydroxymethylbilane synthase